MHMTDTIFSLMRLVEVQHKKETKLSIKYNPRQISFES